MIEEQISLKDFEKKKFLGGGNTGHVYLVKMKKNDQLYAMKVIEKTDSDNKMCRICMEKEILNNINHPFILKSFYSFQTPTKICFVMQYCAGGTFYNMVKRQSFKCLTEEATKFYSAEILLALEYMHYRGYVHRDIKLDNILMNQYGHVVLADFDLAAKSDKPTDPHTFICRSCTKVYSEPDLISDSFVGTLDYLAPEIVVHDKYNSSVDWWSFGVLIYEMLFGTGPFKGKTREELFESIKRAHISFPPHPKSVPSKHIKDIISHLIEKDIKKRLGNKFGAATVKSHSFYKNTKWQLLRNLNPPIIPKLSGLEDSRYFPEQLDGWDLDWNRDQNQNRVQNNKIQDLTPRVISAH